MAEGKLDVEGGDAEAGVAESKKGAETFLWVTVTARAAKTAGRRIVCSCGCGKGEVGR